MKCLIRRCLHLVILKLCKKMQSVVLRRRYHYLAKMMSLKRRFVAFMCFIRFNWFTTDRLFSPGETAEKLVARLLQNVLEHQRPGGELDLDIIYRGASCRAIQKEISITVTLTRLEYSLEQGSLYINLSGANVSFSTVL